jgi:Rrf2 family protein
MLISVIMRMGRGVEWAVHCCHLLAEIPPAASLNSARLAEFFDLPAAYLSKHLQALARGGVITSTPGPQGGYRLARPAEQISLLDVVMAVEGPAPAFRCTEIRQRGPAALRPGAYRQPCAIAGAFARAEDAWRRELQGVTIADLVRTAGLTAPAAMRRAREWLTGAAGTESATVPAGAARHSREIRQGRSG